MIRSQRADDVVAVDQAHPDVARPSAVVDVRPGTGSVS